MPGFRGPAGANGLPGEKVDNFIFINAGTTNRYILLYSFPFIKTWISERNVLDFLKYITFQHKTRISDPA